MVWAVVLVVCVTDVLVVCVVLTEMEAHGPARPDSASLAS